MQPVRLLRAPSRALALAVIVGALLLGSSEFQAAEAKEQVHTVYEGQRLGSIAKRYNISVEDLCKYNGIRENAAIRPGQKLYIPDAAARGTRRVAPPEEKQKPAEKVPPKEPRVHIVARGHTLIAIAQRYGAQVEAICRASGVREKEPLDIGQILIIPDKTDPDGSYARKLRLEGHLDQEERDRKAGRPARDTKSYRKYMKLPRRKGYLELFRYERKWKGFVIGRNGEILPQANGKINWLLDAGGDGPSMEPRLIRLLAQVSDAFGGRPVRLVSGYRTQSWVSASKHKDGRAIDFSIPGVPNEALRDYLRTFENVGVGYYPNSSFVHLDVRPSPAYWVDYAGPGEPPREHP